MSLASWVPRAALAVITALLAATVACAGELPCRLSDQDFAALAQAKRMTCPTCQITAARVPSLTQQEINELCFARRFAHDLFALDADAVTDAYSVKNIPKTLDLYIDERERQKFKDLYYLFLEKEVGRDATVWKGFEYPELGFSVTGPNIVPPRLGERDLEESCGRVKARLVAFSVIKIMLVAGSEEIPPACFLGREQNYLDDFVVGAIVGVRGKPISSSAISVSGVPGRAFEFMSPQGWTIRARYFIVGHRLYYVMTSDTGEGKHPAQVVLRFEQSFRLLPPAV